MSELTYHKRIVKQKNSLSEKERYERKRERRKGRVVEEKVHISWYQQMKLKMMMNPKDYRDYLELQNKKEKPKVETATYQNPNVSFEKPAKFNWFERLILWLNKLFNKNKKE